VEEALRKGANVKITAIDTWVVAIPLRGTFKNAHGVKSVQQSVVVRVSTDEGLVGAGTVDPSPGYSEASAEDIRSVIRERLALALRGHDPVNLRSALQRMDEAAPGAFYAHAAVEMALVDVSAKALGVPAHRLLGGAVRESIQLNGWIGIEAPDAAAATAREFRRRGYRSSKIKVGGGVEADRDRVAAVRAAVPDMEIRVDGNEGYDVEGAIRLARAIAPYRIALLEQPVPRRDLQALARVRRAIDIPVMADEAIEGPDTLLAVIRLEAADIVKVKVMKQGGVLRCLRAIDIAAAAGVRCVIGHGFGLALNTLAELHVAAAASNVLDGCECVGPTKLSSDVVGRPLVMEVGSVPVPMLPGLGAELDDEALTRWDATRRSVPP
jgi:L-alanine-DL-glutamate epimerase-like enolase superfamily enzyme